MQRSAEPGNAMGKPVLVGAGVTLYEYLFSEKNSSATSQLGGQSYLLI